MMTIKEMQKIRARNKQRAKEHPEAKDFFLRHVALDDEIITEIRRIRAERRAERKAER